jgi:hypothetical protein
MRIFRRNCITHPSATCLHQQECGGQFHAGTFPVLRWSANATMFVALVNDAY